MDYVLLALCAFSYTVGIIAQTAAASRMEVRRQLDVGLLARLLGDRVFLIGFGAQVLGFVLAFFARETLPLFLVQTAPASAVGLAAVAGAVILGWRLRIVEIVILLALGCGLMLLIAGAQPSTIEVMPLGLTIGLLGLLMLVGGVAVLAARVPGGRGAVALGALAGIAFAVLAIAGRPIAALPPLELITEPAAWLMVLAAFIGQVLLVLALQRGRSSPPMAAMNATAILLASAVGLGVLGDRVVPGRGPWVLIGLGLVVGGVCALTLLRPGVDGADPSKVINLGKEASTS
jgi:hypothetical protein